LATLIGALSNQREPLSISLAIFTTDNSFLGPLSLLANLAALSTAINCSGKGEHMTKQEYENRPCFDAQRNVTRRDMIEMVVVLLGFAAMCFVGMWIG
jgi:hypothetical protein